MPGLVAEYLEQQGAELVQVMSREQAIAARMTTPLAAKNLSTLSAAQVLNAMPAARRLCKTAAETIALPTAVCAAASPLLAAASGVQEPEVARAPVGSPAAAAAADHASAHQCCIVSCSSRSAVCIAAVAPQPAAADGVAGLDAGHTVVGHTQESSDSRNRYVLAANAGHDDVAAHYPTSESAQLVPPADTSRHVTASCINMMSSIPASDVRGEGLGDGRKGGAASGREQRQRRIIPVMVENDGQGTSSHSSKSSLQGNPSTADGIQGCLARTLLAKPYCAASSTSPASKSNSG